MGTVTSPQPSAADPHCSTGLTRRSALTGIASALLVGCMTARAGQREFAAQIAALQSELGGRVGVHVLDTGSNRELGFGSDDRFAMCSTFKLSLAGAVLARVEAGELSPEQKIRFDREDILSTAPVTSAHLAEGFMSVRELCAAVVETSDNTAANLLLELVGGPSGFTQYLRSIGDRVTRLDRNELGLNTNIPGDPRDTTTPAAMASTVRRLLAGDTLKDASRAQLISWAVNSKTGLKRLRAGLPADWRVGDKTGTGANGAVNDLMIAWPPGRAPIVAAVYMSDSKQARDALEQGHARIGKLIAAAG